MTIHRHLGTSFLVISMLVLSLAVEVTARGWIVSRQLDQACFTYVIRRQALIQTHPTHSRHFCVESKGLSNEQIIEKALPLKKCAQEEAELELKNEEAGQRDVRDLEKAFNRLK